MAVLQMQRFSICAMKKNRKAILEELQALGIMEIDTSIVEDAALRKANTLEVRQGFDKKAVQIDHALEILQEYAPEKTSMFSSLEGRALVEKREYDQITEGKDKVLESANELLTLKKQLTENKAKAVKVENQIESLEPWLSLDIPMGYQGTKFTAVLIGSFGGQLTLEQIYERLAQEAPELEAMDIQVISSDQDQTCVTVFCLRDQATKMEEALRSMGFSKPSMVTDEIPSKQKEKLEQEVKNLEQENAGIEKQIQSYAESRQKLKIVSDYFRARAQKYEVLGEVLQSRQTFLISGYVPEKDTAALQKHMEEKYDLVVDVETPDPEEAPVLLKNNKIAGSVEGVLASYGLPKAGEIDPSAIMSFFYIVFFGLMLSDAAYGVLVFIACAVIIKKFPRMEEGMQKAIRMFMYCGLSTVFWGLMFGGIFGDAVTVVARVFFGKEIVVPALWFVPLEEPMTLLMFCMLFGIIHLFVGLGIKGYLCIKNKQYLDFFCDVVLWYLFLIGLILMLLPSKIFASMSPIAIVFPPALQMLAKVLAIVGAVGLLLMSGRANKNPALRIALGAYDVYNITGWLSDVLSYSRLLALGLATGVIASVVNQMGSMMGKGIIGAIFFIIVFIVGHAMNMAINLLGAYVHTNRLQFVEFFGKFYEGGGRPFQPFKAKTKYVDVKEETSL